ncbi:NERD domain-containing protein [Paenalkalicoccus suaedae]|uniref:NERD domain-containing protein n=1 Tax=Paenalkalicoccus suaedae TaxID=2592382 RepID=A0A859FJP5_9BACI|nr:nuclease-related domain-containing protein [Paenalkalicoccus suaedae]QKS73022.1 NERD domain-containing protein [Paenalkalicoccus suaedae]
MAIVLKRDTINEKRRKQAEWKKKRLNEERTRVIAENKDQIMQSSLIWSILGGFVLFFVFPFGFIAGWFFGRERVLKQKCRGLRERMADLNEIVKVQPGEEGERKVTDRVEKELPEDYLLLNDVVIPNRRSGTQLDHIVIGPTGVFAIETKDITGRFYPHGPRKWQWFPHWSKGHVSKRTVVDSPVSQSIYHAKYLRLATKAAGFDVPVYAIVVMTNDRGNWHGDQDDECPVLRLSTFVQAMQEMPAILPAKTERYKLAKHLLKLNEECEQEFYDGIRAKEA